MKRIQRKRTKGERDAYRRRWLKSPTRPRAKCHPERPHRARGLCDSCYDRWLYANSAQNRNTKLRNAKRWRATNIDKVRIGQLDQKLRKKYGITRIQYLEMVELQQGKCAICKRYFGNKLHVDHDHTTNKIRGLLCLSCNGSLAWLERMQRQSEQWIRDALNYLSGKKVIEVIA
jgi:hypothetical protein